MAHIIAVFMPIGNPLCDGAIFYDLNHAELARLDVFTASATSHRASSQWSQE